jgi:hypothetical protein
LFLASSVWTATGAGTWLIKNEAKGNIN